MRWDCLELETCASECHELRNKVGSWHAGLPSWLNSGEIMWRIFNLFDLGMASHV